MNRKPKKNLRRIAALAVVCSALALLVGGWGWEGADNGTGSDSPPAAIDG